MSVISTLIALTAASLPPPTAATTALQAAERAAKLAALPASDRDIHAGLWRALEIDPGRVVCSVRIPTGTRVPRTSCGELRAWFENRRPREINDGEAPWQLVEEIKERRRKALMKLGAR